MIRFDGVLLLARSIWLAGVLCLAPFFGGANDSSQALAGRGQVRHSNLAKLRNARDNKASDLKPMLPDQSYREILLLEQQCLDEVNRQRQAKGLPNLKFSSDLLEVARYYSRRMAEEKFFSHLDPDGRTVRERVNDAGIRWRTVGENLAYSTGFTNPVAASLHGWMQSPGHRKNILDPDFKKSAVGVWINSTGTVYFTEIFLR